MTATIKAAISPFAQANTEFDSSPMYFLNEDLASVPVSGIPEDFRRLSRYLQVTVLVRKSAAHDETTERKSGSNKSGTGRIDTSDVCSSLDAAKAQLRNPNATDTFEFGGVKGCLSTMEIHRNGRPVILTCKEVKTLVYLIKKPRKVISRDELLNEVWGYENYPCTRTVDNHILRLGKRLEPNPPIPSTFIRAIALDTGSCPKSQTEISSNPEVLCPCLP
jgi:DNA-binding response OmpR family regulator